jgi:hypothetical protein
MLMANPPQRHRFNLKMTVCVIDLDAPPLGVYVIVTDALSLPRLARTAFALAVGTSVTTIRPVFFTVSEPGGARVKQSSPSVSAASSAASLSPPHSPMTEHH